MQRSATRDTDAYRNGAIGMQALKVLQIAIIKGVFVVPLYLPRDPSPLSKFAHMVDLMGLALPRHVVHSLLDDKDRLAPADCRERSPEPLGSFGLAASARDDFLDWNRGCREIRLAVRRGGRKIQRKDRFGVRMKLELKPALYVRVEHCTMLADVPCEHTALGEH